LGVWMTRPPQESFRAAERLIDVEDLDLLVTAFELSKDRANRIALTQLIEAISLSRFIIMPTGENAGWGMHVYDSAIQTLSGRIRQWRRNGCTVDGEAVLRQSLGSQGLEVADPLGPEACWLWLMVLREGSPPWWSMAARRLYACGGPWHQLAVLRPDTKQNRARRDRMVKWYKPRQSRKPPNRN